MSLEPSLRQSVSHSCLKTGMQSAKHLAGGVVCGNGRGPTEEDGNLSWLEMGAQNIEVELVLWRCGLRWRWLRGQWHRTTSTISPRSELICWHLNYYGYLQSRVENWTRMLVAATRRLIGGGVNHGGREDREREDGLVCVICRRAQEDARGHTRYLQHVCVDIIQPNFRMKLGAHG
jgi:hypothetical protein